MSKEKLIIGLVGEKGSGKQTFTDLLKEVTRETIRQIRFSDILVETLNLWDIPTSRLNLQHLAIIMNKEYGLGTLTHAVEHRIQTSSEDIIILDGVRWASDAEMIRRLPRHLLVYITADLQIRYQRLKGKSDKVGEKGLSFEQFMKEEQEKTEVAIPKIGSRADVKITNNGTLEELKAQVVDCYRKIIPMLT